MRTSAEIIAAVKMAAQASSIAKFDVFGSIVASASVKIEDERPGQVQGNETAVVRVRVWGSTGVPGVATTSDLSDAGLRTALAEARAAAELLSHPEIVDFSPEATAVLPEPALSETPRLAPPTEMVRTMVEAERALKRQFPAAQGIPYNTSGSSFQSRFYANSSGAERAEAFNVGYAYLLARAQNEGRKPRTGSAFRIARSFSEVDVSAAVREAGEDLLAHLEYRGVENGKPLVVFSGEAFLQLLGVFSNFVNARNVLDGQSLLTREALGTQVASPALSIFDDARHSQNRGGAVAFDEEGTPTRRTPLVERGVLSGFVQTSQTARAMGLKPTGHAVCGSKITAHNHFWVVEPASTSSRSLEQEEYLIYVDRLEGLHAGARPQQGSFSLPFQGWVFRRGEKTSIDSAVVAGDFLSLLKNVLFVGGQTAVRSAGLSPEVWVEGLSVTGG